MITAALLGLTATQIVVPILAVLVVVVLVFAFSLQEIYMYFLLDSNPDGITQWILPIVLLVLVVGIFVLNYFRSKKSQESMKNMVDSLKVGDNVKTYSGLYGKIIEIVETREFLAQTSMQSMEQMRKSLLFMMLKATLLTQRARQKRARLRPKKSQQNSSQKRKRKREERKEKLLLNLLLLLNRLKLLKRQSQRLKKSQRQRKHPLQKKSQKQRKNLKNNKANQALFFCKNIFIKRL